MRNQKFRFHHNFFITLTLIAGGLFHSTVAYGQMPHQHGSLHGGKLFMNGDDHFEIERVSKKRSYRIFPSDKFRNVLGLDDFEYVKVTAELGETTSIVPVRNPSKSKDSFLIRAPKETGGNAKFVIDYKRKNPPKDYVHPSGPLIIDLSKL